MRKERVKILDGLRSVAILLVMIFHFYTCFDANYYTYKIHIPHFFKYGYLGVELFFIISGFVITLTLTKCNNFIEFIKKRFIRLMPGMMICSLITFSVFYFFNITLFPDSLKVINLFVSNTFISPLLASKVFHSNIQYIDAAYWSLWVEVQFYIIGGLIYFLSPGKFIRNFALFSFASFLCYLVLISSVGTSISGKYLHIDQPGSVRVFFNIFNLPQFSLWFLSGVIVNRLYYSKYQLKYLLLLTSIFIVQMVLAKDVYADIFIILFFLILILFLYYQRPLLFLSSPTISLVGLASYSLYLIHQNIGVLIINRFSDIFGSWNWLLPPILIGLLCFFAVLIYEYAEKPISSWLRNMLLKKSASNIEKKLSALP